MGGDGEHLVSHDQRGLARGATGDDRDAAAAGAGAVGRRLRLALDDRHVVVLDAELVGDDLGHRRLDALAVRRGAEVGDDLAARLDAHGRALRAERRHVHRRRLDVDADAETEQPALGTRGGLLGAERLVVEHLERLVERLERRDLLEHVAAR